jgi:hypothetical protein
MGSGIESGSRKPSEPDTLSFVWLLLHEDKLKKRSPAPRIKKYFNIFPFIKFNRRKT